MLLFSYARHILKMPSNIIATGNDLMVITDFKKLRRYLSTSFTIKLIIIRGIGGGLWGLRDPPETQKSQRETTPETPCSLIVQD